MHMEEPGRGEREGVGGTGESEEVGGTGEREKRVASIEN